MAQGNNAEAQQPQKAYEVERRMLVKRISSMENLPTPSASVMKTMLLLRSEDVDMGQLVSSIEKDQSLVAQLLKMVNSSFYGLRSSVDSVQRAVGLLGTANVKRLVYSASIMEFFSEDEQLEWDHSYSSSLMMANLIKENEIEGFSNLPMAMILHDLGKVVLRRFCPQKYKLVSMQSAKTKSPCFQVEAEALHITHAEAGAILLEKWDSAEEIVIPVLQHHRTDVPQEYVFETALIQFANWVDCSVRGMPCLPPSKELMDAAGIEGIDNEYWLDYQRKLVAGLEGEGPSAKELGSTAGKIQASPPPPPPPPKEEEGMQKTRKIEERILRPETTYSDREMEILDKKYKQEPIPAKAVRIIKLNPGGAPVSQTVSPDLEDTHDELHKRIEEEEEKKTSTQVISKPGRRR